MPPSTRDGEVQNLEVKAIKQSDLIDLNVCTLDSLKFNQHVVDKEFLSTTLVLV